ncbi:MAG TPA: glycosyltransferase, partial [Gemmatimonadales bacterium]|nr:glycosyltransferase [Gemmatimonadales bacterium]
MNASDAPIRTIALIATHGRPALLGRTLESLGADPNPGGPLELVVVENGEAAGVKQICDGLSLRYPIRYLYVAQPGKSNALNFALAQSDAELVVLFDDDVVVAPGTIAAYREAACRHGPGHFFGGPFDADYQERPPDWLIPYLPRSATGWSLGDHEQMVSAPDFIGVNWAVFRQDVLDAGGFAPHRGPNARFRTLGQEEEMQQRLLAAGATGVYVPGARVSHFVPKDRCSVEWALDRRYRSYLTFQLARTRRPKHASLAGVPLWL